MRRVHETAHARSRRRRMRRLNRDPAHSGPLAIEATA
jgi:hypothetical protein